MNQKLLTLLLIIIGLPCIVWSRQVTFPCAGSTIVLMDSASAAAANVKPDSYTQELTAFDIAIRLDKSPSEAMQYDYLLKSAKSMRNWTASEQAQLRKAFAQVDSLVRASGLKLHLPDTVKLARTNGEEEFGAEGYTRGNRIMLNTKAQPISLHLVAHELWHVISRYNEGLRNDAYAAFHFKPCNTIVYKAAMNNRAITNPDCPFLQHYVSIDQHGQQIDVVPVLYSKEAYKSGYRMMENVDIALLALSGASTKTPQMKDGKAVLLSLERTPEFFQQIGMNTQYILHVEEIAAEHFAALIGNKPMNDMKYVEGMRAVLSK